MKNTAQPYISVGIDIGADFSLMAAALPSQELVGKPYKIFHNSQRSLDGAIERIRSLLQQYGLPVRVYMWGDYYDETEFWTGGPWEQNCMFYMDKEKYPQEDYIAPVMTEDDWAMMEQMMTMWVSFAAVGDPSTEDITWKTWSAETEDYIYLAYQGDPLSEMRTGFSELAQPVDMDMMAAAFGFAAGMHDTGSSDPSGEAP